MKEKIASQLVKEINLPREYSERFWQSKINLAKNRINRLNNLSIFNPCDWYYLFHKGFFIEQWTFLLKDYEKQLYSLNMKNSFIKGLRNSLYPDTSDSTQRRG